MKYIDKEIKNSIFKNTKNEEDALLALVHWRWSQFERKRRSVIRQTFKALDITNTEEYSILVYIDLTQTPTSSEISHYLAMEKSTVSEFIKRCILRGLILEKQSENDKRKRFYSLTKSGKLMLNKAHAFMNSINKELFKIFTKEERQKILNMLLKLNSVEDNE